MNAKETKRFYATVQNRMYFVVHRHTVAEPIVGRVERQKEQMEKLNDLMLLF